MVLLQIYIYIVIGFVFNGSLPVFAKFKILPRYRKLLSDEKSNNI
jgi:hypothetical protein